MSKDAENIPSPDSDDQGHMSPQGEEAEQVSASSPMNEGPAVEGIDYESIASETRELPSLFDEQMHGEELQAAKDQKESKSAVEDMSQSLASAAQRLYGVIVKRPVAVTMVALAFAVFGLVAFLDLPVKLMPDLTYPTLTIRTDYPAAAPDKVELAISEKIQERMASIEGLKGHTSTSRQEQSDVVLEFEWGTDMVAASSRAQDAINRVRLDREVGAPQILRFDPAQDPIMRLMLYTTQDGYSLARLRTYAEDILKPELAKLSGVATVRVSGGVKRHLKITPDKKKIENYGLDLNQIVAVIRRENIDSSVGLVNHRGRDVLLRVTSKFHSADQIRELTIPLPLEEGQDRPSTVKLSELAHVDFENEDPESITRFANAGTDFESREGVLLEVLKMGDANIIEVADIVRKALYGTKYADLVQSDGEDAYPDRETRNQIADEARLKDEKSSFKRESEFGLLDTLPGWMGISVLTDQSVFIQASVDEVRDAALVGGVLAIIIIFLFLTSVWSTFLIFLSIGLSIVATFIPMGTSGLSLNLMSLGGLALGIGMLVDNSIVVLESIARCREEGDDPIRAAARGTGEVASAIVASTFTTIAVFFPIVFVQGMVGQVFKEQSLTVVFSLLASLVVALLVIPAYAGIRLSKPKDGVDFLGKTAQGIISQFRWGETRLQNIVFSPFYLLNSLFVVVIGLVVGLVLLVLALIFLVLFGVFITLRHSFGYVLLAASKGWLAVWRVVEEGYAILLKGALETPALIVGVSLVAFVASMYVGSGLDSELIPPLNEKEFYVDIEAPEGTRLIRTDNEAVSALEVAAQDGDFPNWVSSVMTEVGGDAAATSRPVSSATVRYVVNLAPGAPPMEEVGEVLKSATQQSHIFDTQASLSRPSLFSLKRPMVVLVRGKDLGLLALGAEEVAKRLRELKRDDGEPMLREVKTSTERGSPQIRILLDPRKLDAKGLNKRQVADALALQVRGETVTDYDEGGEKMDVFLNQDIDRDAGRTLERLRSLEVLPNAAPGVRLGDLLKNGEDALVPVAGESRILRTETERVVEVTATPNGVPLGTIRAAIDQSVRDSGIQSDELRITAAGQMEELDESNASLYFALALAVFLVYVVMAVQFESLIDPLIIMGSVPLAAVGVILMLWVGGSPISVIVMLGAIVLAGIVVNNAIVLIDYANRLRATGIEAREAIYRAGKVRLRPIAITTLTTVLGMLPMTGWLFGASEGQELRAPMAQTVVVGLMTSTVLTLVVIPTIYSLVHSRRSKEAKQSSESTPKARAVDAL